MLLSSIKWYNVQNTRSFDTMRNDDIKWETHHGRQPYQRMKAYIVMSILKKHTDEDNVMSANELVEWLDDYGISAEKKSIYKDIEEINIFYNLDSGESNNPYEVEEGLKTGEFEKVIHYNEHKKGFYYKDLNRDYEDYRLISEAIYCAKFLDQKQANRLVEVATENISKFAQGKIRHNVSNLDSQKTDNTDTFFTITKISDAMSLELDDTPHEPCKISFRYMKHKVNDIREKVERRNGDEYIVSPYELIINDGNYYLRAFDDKSQQMRTYRLDRMRKVKVLEGQPRDGEEVATADKHNYQRGMFGMFSGEKQSVRLRFTNDLLETVYEKLGGTFASYRRVDDWHFEVSADVEISKPFFGWMCGFGKKAVIAYPETVKDDFKKFIDDISSNY